VQLNCHFFVEAEIEFDLDPREVRGQEQLTALLVFMAQIAAATNKSCMMTPESMHEVAILRSAPGGDTVRSLLPTTE
jgi:hypothetical protein